MSYILDALKMSEQAARQREAGPHTSLLPVIDEPVEGHRTGWYLLIAGALLVNAVAFVVLFRPHLPAVSAEPAALVTRVPAPAPVATAQPPQVVPAPVAAMASPRTPPVPKLARSADEQPHQPEAAATVEAVTESNLLSPSLQKTLPPITVSGFILDNDSNRLVIVNDLLVREGDEAAPGVKVEKVLEDGVIFSFKGRQFRR